MDTPLSFTKCRIEPTDIVCDQVPVIPVGTPLVDVAQVFASLESRHLLVQDGSELVGVISTDDLQQATRTFTETGTAWHQRVVESLIVLPFNDGPQPPASKIPPAIEQSRPQPSDCVSVCEGSDLVALLTSEDVLLSWNRLEPALARVALDTLTQLPNRSHFERRFREEWQRASRMKTAVGLLIIDVDHFKEINDAYGHRRGDMVLASVAQCCQRFLRSYDLVARFAGDEFIALTSGCSLKSIEHPVRRLQQSTQEMNLRFNGDRVNVTLSIGAAVVNEPGKLEPAQLFDAADHCLYEAKNKGRSRAYRAELREDGTLAQESMLVPLSSEQQDWSL